LLNFKKHFYFFVTLVTISFIWWFLYLLLVFPKNYHSKVEDIKKEESAIIVLTGGKGRFEKGFSLLKQNKSENLFITGVYPGQNLRSKYDLNDFEKELFDCCIIQSHKAINTKENAVEVKKWIKDKNLKEIVLVSSYYHLPRSKIIFDKEIPDIIIKLVPADDDIFDSDTFFDYLFNFRVIMTEYIKILYIIFFEKE